MPSDDFQKDVKVTESGTKHAIATHAQISIAVNVTRCIRFLEFTENLPSMIKRIHAYFRASSCGNAYCDSTKLSKLHWNWTSSTAAYIRLILSTCLEGITNTC